MMIEISSVNRGKLFLAYRISCKGIGSYAILSLATNHTSEFNFSVGLHGVIDDASVVLTSNETRSPGILRIGNKSLNQLKLGQFGCCIPDTVVLDFSFFDAFKKNTQVDLEEIYHQYIAKRLGPSLAIRCSSNIEDGEWQTYAGQFDTYLNVPNEYDKFKEKIILAYQRFCSAEGAYPHDSLQDIQSDDLKLGIMVQRLIKPKFSGFLFTSDPMDPPNQWLKIEYWPGEREKSEGGAITLNCESGKRMPTGSDSTSVPLPVEFQEKLYLAAKELVEQFGFPQDIEFVISAENEQLYIVQSRPITAFSYSPDKIYFEEQNRLSNILETNLNLYQRGPILSSTNISELFVQAIPLGYSIFKYGFAGTIEEEGGISIGRSRLGYAKLNLEDQVNLFYTVADKARTNIIVDALTFRLPGISKEDYLRSFVAHYLRRIEQNPTEASYPEDGLYLQNDKPEHWREIAGDKGEILRKEYSEFFQKIVDHHAPNEIQNASIFFEAHERFYRAYLSRNMHSVSEINLKEEVKEILNYLRTTFCPQYVVFARLAFLCTHLAKEKLTKTPVSKISVPERQILNELLSSVEVDPSLDGPNYALFERLFKTGRITLWEFLDKFQHLGSLDINQPRLGEYSLADLYTLFQQGKHYEHGDGRLQFEDVVKEIDTEIIALGLEKMPDFWVCCTYAGQFMRIREKAKYEFLKALYVVKRIVRELARIHRLGDLVFYLEYDELLELSVDSRNLYKLLALQRKAYIDGCKHHKVRDVLMDLKSTPFERRQVDDSSEQGKLYKYIRGQSVFYGHAEGVCLTAGSNVEYLNKLMTYQAEKIGPIIGIFKGVELSYFNLSALAGFTTENGGYLSHAATIAREFKLPYLTGIKVDQLRDGDYVILDTENQQVIYRR